MTDRRIRVLVGDAAREGSGGELPRVPLDHALDPKERVRWERGATWRLLVVRVPRRTEPSQLAFDTVPVGVVITDHDLAIVSACENDVTRELRPRDGEVARIDDVIVCVLHAVARSFAETVEITEDAIDSVEAALARSLRNTEVLALLRYQKALVLHSTALRALVTILDRLPEAFSVEAHDRHFLDEVSVELRQALEVADLERETLGATMDAFASIISNYLNDVMRVLTGAAVVLTPPVAIASFWGMNVPLPLARDPQAFWILVGISTALSVLVFSALRWRRWL